LQRSSQQRKKILSIFGTRPEAIKMAPLVKGLEKDKLLRNVTCVTAQHREMLDQVLDSFSLVQDYDLDIMQSRQTLEELTRRSLKGLGEIIRKENPDLILVHGDTTTTLCGSLAAFYEQTAVGHVEAGLRTGNKYHPFPEEMNRHLTGVLADMHFAPTSDAKDNLMKEGIDREKIFITGNTVTDALMLTVQKKYKFIDSDLIPVDSSNSNMNELKMLINNKNSRDIPSSPLLLLTAHRRENLGKPLIEICKAADELLERNRKLQIVFPVHLNPRVRETAVKFLGKRERIYLIEPPSYLPFAHLMAASDVILTDSGGIQEEAPTLGKPVLVLREVTERREAVESKTAVLVGTDRDRIVENADKLLNDRETYQRMTRRANPYGDGDACGRIIEAIHYYFGLIKQRPEEFNY